MAITFLGGPLLLAAGIRRAGYEIINVIDDAGDLERSLRMTLNNGITVAWDRDSRSIWAEGPPTLCERVEAKLSRIAGTGRGSRSKRRKVVLALLLTGGVAGGLGFLALRPATYDPVAPPPAAAVAPTPE